MTWYVQYTVTATAFICMFNVQVHIDKGNEGGPSSADPVKLAWRHGKPAPEHITQSSGTVVVHERTAYFSVKRRVYSYTVSIEKWIKLPKCKFELFGLAVVEGELTTIGGTMGYDATTNSLFSLSGSSWKEVLPPMPTKRYRPAAASTPTYLVVAGGKGEGTSGYLSTVEVLSQETLQWSTASSLPVGVPFPQLTLCGESFYLLDENSIYSCSVEDLIKSCKIASNGSDGGSVWTKLAAVPVRYSSGLVTLRGCVLAIGGAHDRFGRNPTGAIHCYNVTTNSWSVIGEVLTPRSEVLAAVLYSNDLVVALSWRKDCSIVDIGSC